MNEIKALEADTKAQEEADKTGFQSKEAALNDELAKLTAELAKRKDEDRESELTLTLTLDLALLLSTLTTLTIYYAYYLLRLPPNPIVAGP